MRVTIEFTDIEELKKYLLFKETTVPTITKTTTSTTSNEDMLKEIRVLLPGLVKTNRDEIVDKLKEFSANSVSSLEPKHYSEFLNFLKDIISKDEQ